MAVRVRYAPSPTGSLHLGGLRTALINYLFARASDGDYILRIEDTDRSRGVAGSQKSLIEILKWCGIQHTEGPDVGGPYGPYVQTERMHIYKESVNTLLDNKSAYRCFCSRDRLAALSEQQLADGAHVGYDGHCQHLSSQEVAQRMAREEQFTVRLKTTQALGVEDSHWSFTDMLRGKISLPVTAIHDHVLVRSDGMPTYHLASVVDDCAMDITHVIRGEEWVQSTPKHIALCNSLGLPAPQYLHLPLLLNQDGGKMSKRSVGASVQGYKDAGYPPEALVNFVATLGCSQHNELTDDSGVGEIMQLEDMAKQFDIAQLSANPTFVFNDQINFFSKAHMQILTETDEGRSRLHEAAVLSVPQARDYDADYTARVVQFFAERFSSMNDFQNIASVMYSPPDFAAIGLPSKLDLKTSLLKSLIAELSMLDHDFDKPDLMAAVDRVRKQHEDRPKRGRVLQSLRFATTAATSGPDLVGVLQLIGLSRTLERVALCVDWMEGESV